MLLGQVFVRLTKLVLSTDLILEELLVIKNVLVLDRF